MPEQAATIGLLGAGLLGQALLTRWIGAGVRALVYDPAPAAAEEALQAGAIVAPDGASVVARCAVVALCLPDSDVTARLLPELERLAEGALVVDFTTGDPLMMENISRRLATRGIGYVDASIGGSSHLVRKGEAIVLAGGETHFFERARPFLEIVAERVFHLGPPGAGARCKLVFNLVLGLNRAALAEGLALAEASGLAQEKVVEVLRSGAAASRVMETKAERMIRREYKPEARLRQHWKDVRLILRQGRRSGLRLPMSETHESLLAKAVDAGWGDADNSAIREVYELLRLMPEDS